MLPIDRPCATEVVPLATVLPAARVSAVSVSGEAVPVPVMMPSAGVVGDKAVRL